MYDVTNNFRAELNGCEILKENFDGLGEVTGISATEDNAVVQIYSADEQGSIESIFENSGDYILISYIGDTPNISYDYHVNGEKEGTILSIQDVGEMFGKFEFNPNDDLITGTIKKPVSAALLRGKISIESSKSDTTERKRTLIIQSMRGKVYKGASTLTAPVLDILSMVDGRRMLISRSYIDRPVYGTLRKMMNISFKKTTKLLSFSFGNIKTDDESESSTEERKNPVLLSDLYNSSNVKNNIKIIMKMLDTPNKIYNKEVTI